MGEAQLKVEVGEMYEELKNSQSGVQENKTPLNGSKNKATTKIGHYSRANKSEFDTKLSIPIQRKVGFEVETRLPFYKDEIADGGKSKRMSIGGKKDVTVEVETQSVHGSDTAMLEIATSPYKSRERADLETDIKKIINLIDNVYNNIPSKSVENGKSNSMPWRFGLNGIPKKAWWKDAHVQMTAGIDVKHINALYDDLNDNLKNNENRRKVFKEDSYSPNIYKKVLNKCMDLLNKYKGDFILTETIGYIEPSEDLAKKHDTEMGIETKIENNLFYEPNQSDIFHRNVDKVNEKNISLDEGRISGILRHLFVTLLGTFLPLGVTENGRKQGWENVKNRVPFLTKVELGNWANIIGKKAMDGSEGENIAYQFGKDLWKASQDVANELKDENNLVWSYFEGNEKSSLIVSGVHLYLGNMATVQSLLQEKWSTETFNVIEAKDSTSETADNVYPESPAFEFRRMSGLTKRSEIKANVLKMYDYIYHLNRR